MRYNNETILIGVHEAFQSIRLTAEGWSVMFEGVELVGQLWYKVFNPDWTCRDMQYQAGAVYEMTEAPILCRRGFHYCVNPADCFNYYYFNPENKVALILACGTIHNCGGDKSCTNKIAIIREILWSELLNMLNVGHENTGRGNTGDGNSGNCNSGQWNFGSRNTGNKNIGSDNTGNRNGGHWNTGECNFGASNSGDFNVGDFNTGDYNQGRRNTGSHNTGIYNSGNYNFGNFCTGDFNSANDCSGVFCTDMQKIRMFDMPTNMNLHEWRSSLAYSILRKVDDTDVTFVNIHSMTDEEKEDHPYYKDLGGYYKKTGKDPMRYAKWWDSLKKWEKKVILEIPNFDAAKFKHITGVDVNNPKNHIPCFGEGSRRT